MLLHQMCSLLDALALFCSVHRGAERVECKKELKMRFLWLDVCSWRGLAWRGVLRKTNDERKEKGNRREMRCNPLKASIIANIYKSPSTSYFSLLLAAAAEEEEERSSNQRAACRENTHSQEENEKRSFSFFFDIRPSVLFVLVV